MASNMNNQVLEAIFADTDEEFDLLLAEDADGEGKIPTRHGDGTSIPQLQQLKPNHMTIIEYHLMVYSQSEICRLVQCSAYTVHRTLRDTLAQP